MYVSAQQDEAKKREMDSVYGRIYDLLDAGRYTDAQKLIMYDINVYRADTEFVASLYLNLSDAERLSGNKDISMEHINTAEDVMRSSDDIWRRKKHLAYQRRANLYYEMQEFDSAFVYAQMSIASAKENNPPHLLAMQTHNLPIIGHGYFLRKQYEQAEDMYERSAAISDSMGWGCDLPNIYVKLAEVEAKRQRYDLAVYYITRAYDRADTCKDQNYKLAAVNKSIDIYRQFGEYKKMSDALELKIKLMDEIQIHEQKTQLQELETEFSTKLKEEENKSLKAINEEQKKQSRFQWAVIVLSVLMLVTMSAFAFSYWRQKGRIGKQKEDVERLNVLNQKIFSVISHDFKGPMMGIDMLLGMQEKYGMDAETFNKQTAMLRNDLSQANLVMENLLNWSRTELGYTGFQKNVSDVCAVYDEVAAQLKTLYTQKKLTLENRVPKEADLPIPPDVLRIILRNLLGNAIKYSHEGGAITFGYNMADRSYVLRDQGIGMDADRLNRLFMGASESRLGTRHESGYGIGLHLVHELVHKHHGRIWAESEPNRGTSVYFSFA